MYQEPIGQVLQQARQKLGKTAKEVELDTKIRAKYIEALEKDNFATLPGSIYAKGFIKVYANYLGIESAPLIQQYKNLYEQENDLDITRMPANLRVKKKTRPSWFKFAVALGTISAIFIALIVWGAIVKNVSKEDRLIVQDIKTRKTSVTAVAAKTTVTTAKTGADSNSNNVPASKVGDRNNAVDSGTEDKAIDIKAKLTGINDDGSWVKVTVDGDKKFEGVIPGGETKSFKGSESVRVRIGKPNGIKLVINGKKVDVSELRATNGIIDKTFRAKDVDEMTNDTGQEENKAVIDNGER